MVDISRCRAQNNRFGAMSTTKTSSTSWRQIRRVGRVAAGARTSDSTWPVKRAAGRTRRCRSALRPGWRRPSFWRVVLCPSGCARSPTLHGGAEPAHGSLIALHQATVALLLHGPNDVIPDDLLALKGIAHLLEEAGAAFGICHTELMQEEGARRAHEASDGPVGAAATDGFGLNHGPLPGGDQAR